MKNVYFIPFVASRLPNEVRQYARSNLPPVSMYWSKRAGHGDHTCCQNSPMVKIKALEAAERKSQAVETHYVRA